jgi:small subunit ribosomal protein S16
MAVKIRLARGGKKKKPYYWITVADARSPRDGKFLERIGSYNPMTHPATVTVNLDRALYWLGCGAIPTDTAKNLLSNQGVLYKRHLTRGVKMNILTQEQADQKFTHWIAEKEAKLKNAMSAVELKKEDARKERAKIEAEISQKKAEAKAEKLNAAALASVPTEEVEG